MLENAITPQLNTSFIEPLSTLEKRFLENRTLIVDWFNRQWQLSRPPVYGSVDLRNAGFKLAPIDMNLFPAGFNNLNPEHLPLSVKSAKKILGEIMQEAKSILILPESHTRNVFYWSNIKTLEKILIGAGYHVKFGSLDETVTAPQVIALADAEDLVIYPLMRKENRLSVEGFLPDLILLNNDLSSGIPEILQQVEQQLIPPAKLGWSERLKSEHFQYYAEVAAEFAKVIDIDPWLISPLFRHCGQINFMQQDGLDCLIANAETLFAEVQKKYVEYNIPYQPFLIVKADAGTYGMAVMTVRNIDELTSLNRKQRTRMSTIKGGQPVTSVIIQEGVYTFETVGSDQAVAEPVVYLWGSNVVGGFYRVHKDRGIDENLNSPGMHFEPIAFVKPCNEPCDKSGPGACENRFYAYGIVAQLSMLAAAREIKDHQK